MSTALKQLSGMLLITFGVIAILNETQAEERNLEGDGRWSKADYEKLALPACRQTWACGPDNVVHLRENEEVTFAPPRRTDGTCVARGAAPCRSCDALPPVDACRWQIVSTENSNS